ncbi:MAG: MBL fold metallo-hydrolase [Verrucomicrobia bacterium]|nr:MBL fold metallo-hydrolase [Verrucomicrobiota bacterium]
MKIHILDTRQLGRAGIVAATALETDDGIALFDTGPESTFDNVIVDLRKAGFEPTDVRHVFLSHIHFDHAGAAWRFASPSRTGGSDATIYVHPKGAPHLIDPSKLIESATRIFGDDMDRLWGKIAPVPKVRLKILEDNDLIHVPPFEIRAVATLGHASHHHVYHWDNNVFGGDIAGVRIGNGPPIPPFVPPELNIESWRKSIAKIRRLNAINLYLPHFGKIAGSVDEHLAELDKRVARWSEWFRNGIRAGESESSLRSKFAELEHAELRGGGASQAEVDGYEAADPSYMAVGAATRYWKKFHPDALPK